MNSKLQSPISTLKVGIAGFGKAAEIYHSPFINVTEGLMLYAVLERNRSRAKELYPWVKTVRSYEELLSDRDIDIIVITTPNDFHYSMAKEALLKGKHVVVDKPFTVTLAEADDLIRIAKETGKVLTVFHNRRLDGPFLAAKKYIGEKLIGETLRVEIRFDRFRPEINKDSWRETTRPGSGLLYDLGSHLIDQALRLFGVPESIDSKILSQRSEAISDDFFELVFHYPTVEVMISAGMLVQEQTPHYKIVGTEGSLVIPDLDPQESFMKQGIFPPDSRWPKEFKAIFKNREGKKEVFLPAGNYSLFYENFYNSITKGEKLLIQPSQAREVIRIIEEVKGAEANLDTL